MPVLMDSAAEAQVSKNIVNSIIKQTGCRDMTAKADITELDQIQDTLVAVLTSMADRKVIWDDKDPLTPNLVLDFGPGWQLPLH